MWVLGKLAVGDLPMGVLKLSNCSPHVDDCYRNNAGINELRWVALGSRNATFCHLGIFISRC